MPDLLLFSFDAVSEKNITQIGEALGFRIKATCDLKTAISWVELRKFSAVIVNSAVTIKTQQDLAGALWQSAPLAVFLSYDPTDSSQISSYEIKLYGAELINSRQSLEERLKRLSPVQAKLEGRDFSVMVVEDLDSPRDIICFFLESLGYASVKGFASAKEALSELQKDPAEFDCIVTDVRMPEISGKELIEQVRSNSKFKHLPVIVLTAHGTVDCLVDCLKAGASGFLVKPPKRQDLTRELCRAQRLSADQADPCLVTPSEAEYVRELILSKGLLR